MRDLVELCRELAVLMDRLNHDEMEVLVEVARGLAGPGRDTYGPLNIDDDPRDFDAELLAEERDALVYGAIKAIQRRRRREGLS